MSLRTRVDSKLAYGRFVNRVKTTKVVWFLLDLEENYPSCCDSNNEETSVVPFWSDRAYAKRAMSKFRFETKVDSIQLENFIDHTLPHLMDRGFKIGPNWDLNLAGLEIEPSELFSFFE